MKEPAQPPIEGIGTELVPIDRFTKLTSTELVRSNIDILTVLYGRRSLATNDLESFHEAFMMDRAFDSYTPISIRESDEITDPTEELRPGYEQLSRLVTDINKPLVVVLITTPETAEKEWFEKTPEFIRELRKAFGQTPSLSLTTKDTIQNMSAKSIWQKVI